MSRNIYSQTKHNQLSHLTRMIRSAFFLLRGMLVLSLFLSTSFDSVQLWKCNFSGSLSLSNDCTEDQEKSCCKREVINQERMFNSSAEGNINEPSVSFTQCCHKVDFFSNIELTLLKTTDHKIKNIIAQNIKPNQLSNFSLRSHISVHQQRGSFHLCPDRVSSVPLYRLHELMTC